MKIVFKIAIIRFIVACLGVYSIIGVCVASQDSEESQYSQNSQYSEATLGPRGTLKATIKATIEKAGRLLLEKERDDRYWNFPANLGTHYISQYFLILKFLNRTETALDVEQLRHVLLTTQLEDGSWYAVKDANLKHGDLNATFLNYWALKVMGEKMVSPHMTNARRFILAGGGIENLTLFSQIFLSLFKNYSWADIAEVPYLLFSQLSPINEKKFAQWIGPHMEPIAYLKKMLVSKDLGPAFALDELWANKRHLQKSKASMRARNYPGWEEKELIADILKRQLPKGSWGAYTVSTLLTLIVLDDYISRYPDFLPKTQTPTEKGFSFIEKLYFNNTEGSYLGALDDGRYWDTALAGIALKEAVSSGSALGSDIQTRLHSTVEYLSAIQTEGGGFPFGEDFEYAPDVDDTAEIIIFLNSLPGTSSQIDKAVKWILSMQNIDGGWGAFSKNNKGCLLLKLFEGKFENSADLFDPSSPDVTGHVLEALGNLGYNMDNSASIRAAVRYLKRAQASKSKTWIARWGVNGIYGIGAVIVGLSKVGEDVNASYVQDALNWLVERQNKDGGFGEATISYTDASWLGKGVSTPAQSAWALLALLAGKRSDSVEAARVVKYLIDNFKNPNNTLANYIEGQISGGVAFGWTDPSAVGTGHPGLIYMNYPSYPYTFPLIALSRYLSLTN